MSKLQELLKEWRSYQDLKSMIDKDLKLKIYIPFIKEDEVKELLASIIDEAEIANFRLIEILERMEIEVATFGLISPRNILKAEEEISVLKERMYFTELRRDVFAIRAEELEKEIKDYKDNYAVDSKANIDGSYSRLIGGFYYPLRDYAETPKFKNVKVVEPYTTTESIHISKTKELIAIGTVSHPELKIVHSGGYGRTKVVLSHLILGDFTGRSSCDPEDMANGKANIQQGYDIAFLRAEIAMKQAELEMVLNGTLYDYL